jgi:hypothetical protein
MTFWNALVLGLLLGSGVQTLMAREWLGGCLASRVTGRCSDPDLGAVRDVYVLRGAGGSRAQAGRAVDQVAVKESKIFARLTGSRSVLPF